MDSQIEITVRLGWDAEVLSHEGREYLPDKEGCFVLPQGVYFDLRTRGLAMEYLSEAEAKPPKKKAPRKPSEGETDLSTPSDGDDGDDDGDPPVGGDPEPVVATGEDGEPLVSPTGDGTDPVFFPPAGPVINPAPDPEPVK